MCKLGRKKSKDEPSICIPSTPLIKEGEPLPDFVKRVDDFVDLYYNGDFVIDTTKAFKISFSIEGHGDNLGHWLSFGISEYCINKNKTIRERCNAAYWLFQIITHAFAVNVIKKGDGFLTKLKEVEKENNQLKETKMKLEVKILDLEKTIEEYKKALNVLANNSSSDVDE